jgi:hypothetical protein
MLPQILDVTPAPFLPLEAAGAYFSRIIPPQERDGLKSAETLPKSLTSRNGSQRRKRPIWAAI